MSCFLSSLLRIYITLFQVLIVRKIRVFKLIYFLLQNFQCKLRFFFLLYFLLLTQYLLDLKNKLPSTRSALSTQPKLLFRSVFFLTKIILANNQKLIIIFEIALNLCLNKIYSVLNYVNEVIIKFPELNFLHLFFSIFLFKIVFKIDLLMLQMNLSYLLYKLEFF